MHHSGRNLAREGADGVHRTGRRADCVHGGGRGRSFRVQRILCRRRLLQRVVQQSISSSTHLGAREQAVDERVDDGEVTAAREGVFCKNSLHANRCLRHVVRALTMPHAPDQGKSDGVIRPF